MLHGVVVLSTVAYWCEVHGTRVDGAVGAGAVVGALEGAAIGGTEVGRLMATLDLVATGVGCAKVRHGAAVARLVVHGAARVVGWQQRGVCGRVWARGGVGSWGVTLHVGPVRTCLPFVLGLRVHGVQGRPGTALLLTLACLAPVEQLRAEHGRHPVTASATPLHLITHRGALPPDTIDWDCDALF